MKRNDIRLRDPFLLLWENRYYLYGTRGRDYPVPGFDVYVSDDLETWSEPKPVFGAFPGFWGTRDFWAPEVHVYRGKCYMLATFKSDTACRGTAVLVADRPDGEFVPWSDGPVTPRDWECLDGTLYVEDGTPYLVFCHEWLQIGNGTVCAVALTPDLKAAAGEPFQLWAAADAPWAFPVRHPGEFVTDGPFLFREDGVLKSIWSSFDASGYVEALAVSAGGIHGPWNAALPPVLTGHDGGHGMLLTDQEGKRRFVCHQPNAAPLERPVLYDWPAAGEVTA